ncbi:hypothetical protein V8G54_005048 [Vigna mungo]|uniref:Uncharacterized protein n=1 Tax=Vigna mungo TaxID=3915 RepID=A0AAQ3PHS9_VIGMU
MKGDCYPELVEVFYNNVKEVDENIHSRLKGVDIVINNNTWLEIAGLKYEGRLSHQPDCLQNQRTRKIEMFKDCMSKVLEQSGLNLSGEKKLTWSKANLIGKATLTCIGLKKIALGWYFRDEKRATKRINTLKKTLSTLNEKMDEIFKHYVDISTSLEESVREDVDDISKESSTESSELE